MTEIACFLALLMGLRLHKTVTKEINIWKCVEQYCALIYAIYSMKEKEGKKLS